VPTNKQRREASRRHLERQLQQRQEREARRKKITLITSVAGAVVLIVGIVVAIAVLNGGNGNKHPQAGGTNSAKHTHSASVSPSATTSAPTQAASYPCTWTKDAAGQAAKKVDVPPTTKPPKKGVVTVSVKTTQGAMTLKLNRASAPCTVESFVSLVKQKYYDRTPCHRLVTAGIYVLQCGDPTGTGTGGPGYTVPDEATGNEKYPAGTVAMARTSQPHSGGSQFFIVYKNSPTLMQHLGAQQYTVFGTVSRGLGVVKKVADKGAVGGTDGKPKLPITITSMRAA